MYKFEGKLIDKGELKSGTSAAGKDWKIQKILVEEQLKESTKKVPFTVFSKNVDSLEKISLGSNIEFSFAIKSREYNGNTYIDLEAFGITVKGANADEPKKEETPEVTTEAKDDLPF